ncbi:MAG: hypothetical protein Pars2KO_15790 [Parasphingorhabdus sp.]
MSKSMNKLGLSSAIVAMFLVGCTTPSEGTIATESEREPVQSSSYERGKLLLFNAKNRFEYPKATKLLETAVLEDNGNPSARLALLYAYSKLSKYDEAADQIAKLNPQRVVLNVEELAWLNALAARTANDKPQEIIHWMNASRINPKNRWVWYELASAYASAENYSEAAKAAEQALAVEPDHSNWEASWIHYLHAKSLFRSNQYEKAITAAAAGKGNLTTLRSTYFREVIAKVAADPAIDARPMVDEYVRISNAEKRNSPHYTQVNISLFYFELGRLDKAIAHAEQALELDKSTYAYWALGYALIENGNAKKALPILDAAIKADPDDAMLWGAKAWAQYRLGKVRSALDLTALAESKTKREINILSRNRAAIENALANPESGPAPKLAWLD